MSESRVRRAFDGLGGYIAALIVLLAISVMCLLLLLQSPSDKLLWTGTKVIGSERDGLDYYTWRGVPYTLDVPGFASKPHVTLFLNPSSPEAAIADSTPRRVLDGLFIVGPLVLGAGVLGGGLLRRRSIRRGEDRPGGFGTGLDPDLVNRLLEQNRGPQR
jgi:hypothetical protein